VYNYPYDLLHQLPSGRMEKTLNHLVSVVTEKLSLQPDVIQNIEVEEPLKTWLISNWRDE